MKDNTGYVPTEFGIALILNPLEVYPTVETIYFLLADNDLDKRTMLEELFTSSSVWVKNNILVIDSFSEGSWAKSIVRPSQEFLAHLKGKEFTPQYSADFPAEQLHTTYEWSDLILSGKVMAQILEIKNWILHEKTIMDDWGFSKHLKKGYRAIFSGKSGTGKTLTTTLLGKATGLPVYRIDISSMVSKYIGETEKNLERLFQIAENRNWILFFDEAESLFARRSAVKDAQDNYANQTVAYLLQRIEDFNGVIILCTNKPTNIDDAFVRRFQAIIPFPEPSEEERLQLWRNTFNNGSLLIDKQVNFEFLAKVYTDITGGILINILRNCVIRVAERKDNTIMWDDIIFSLKKEYTKHFFRWVEPESKGWKA